MERVREPIARRKYQRLHNNTPDFVRDGQEARFVSRRVLSPSAAVDVDHALGGGSQVVISGQWSPTQSADADAGDRDVANGYGDLHNERGTLSRRSNSPLQ